MFTLLDVSWSTMRLLSLGLGALVVDCLGIEPLYSIGGTLLFHAGALGSALLGGMKFDSDGERRLRLSRRGRRERGDGDERAGEAGADDEEQSRRAAGEARQDSGERPDGPSRPRDAAARRPGPERLDRGHHVRPDQQAEHKGGGEDRHGHREHDNVAEGEHERRVEDVGEVAWPESGRELSPRESRGGGLVLRDRERIVAQTDADDDRLRVERSSARGRAVVTAPPKRLSETRAATFPRTPAARTARRASG